MPPAFTPPAHAEQAPMCPSAQSGWIGQARWIFTVRRCLLNGITCGDALTGLLRQCKLNGAEGASQSGKIVNVFPHG